MKKRIAIIGTGISGLSSAYYLQKMGDFDLTLFEKSDRIGGHTATMDVCYSGQNYAIDTGFIVFNEWTYPHFIQLLQDLKVESQPTSMGFSLSCLESGLEYSGANFGTLFAQKRHLLNPLHWLMLRDIVRFNKNALNDLEQSQIDDNLCLGDYLNQGRYGKRFRQFYLIPMASAIWSSSLKDVEKMPLRFFVQFFKNHGLLSVKNRPQWRVIKGGSKSYLAPLTESFKKHIRLSCPVQAVRRQFDGEQTTLYVDSATAEGEPFDEVVFACHSDQALALLQNADEQEHTILSAIPYSHNEVVLHTDERLLPKSRKTWSSWNYLLGRNREKAVLTYNMNILQGIESDATFSVTLNDTESIDSEKILGTYQYAHPEFSLKGIAAQASLEKYNGTNHTWFCGAWCGNGFHEDGVLSALKVAQRLAAENPSDIGDLS